MKVTKVNGVHLHYREDGDPDGVPLVFVNSLGTDLRAWGRVVERLGGGFRIIRYDKRGHGLSEATPAPYAMDEHVADLAALMESCEVDRAVVCGISVGGMIAQGLAAAHPGRVRALVLCDTGHRIGTTEAWNDRIDAIRAGGIEAMADAIVERWFSERFRAERAEEVVGWRNMLVRTTVDGYTGTSAAIRDTDLTEQARAIAAPTLCLCGTADMATTPELVQELASLIDGARYEPIEGAGHLPCIEMPDEMAALIGSFAREAAG